MIEANSTTDGTMSPVSNFNLFFGKFSQDCHFNVRDVIYSHSARLVGICSYIRQFFWVSPKTNDKQTVFV